MSGHHILLLAAATPDDRKCHAVIESLHRQNCRVSVASHSFNSGPLQSKFIHSRLPLPPQNAGLDQGIEAIQHLARNENFDACVPTNDFYTLALGKACSEPGFELACAVPPAESVELCKDKAKTAALATRLGIEVPQSIEVEDQASLENIAERLRYPCILKPRTSAGAIGLSVAENREQLLQAWQGLPKTQGEVFDFSRPLVQHKIDGDVHEVCGLFCNGEPRAMLTQRRIRMYPPGAGAGIYNVTNHLPELMQRAEKLFRALQWHGPAQAEFIVDRHSGRPYLLEVNGRFWGTLALSVAAGMDFPMLTCQLAIEGDIPVQTDYQQGLHYRWPVPFGLMHAIESRQWIRFVTEFLLPRPGHRSDLNLRNPGPLLYELNTAWKRFRSRGFKTARQSGNQYEWLENSAKTGQETHPGASAD